MKCGCQDRTVSRGILSDMGKYYDRKHQLRSDGYIAEMKALDNKCDQAERKKHMMTELNLKHVAVLEDLQSVCHCTAEKAVKLPTDHDSVDGFVEEIDKLENIVVPVIQDDVLGGHLDKITKYLKVILDCLDRFSNNMDETLSSVNSSHKEVVGVITDLEQVSRNIRNINTDNPSRKELRSVQQVMQRLIPPLQEELNNKQKLEQQVMHLMYNVFQMDHLKRKEHHVTNTIHALQKERKLIEPKRRLMERQLVDINQQIREEKKGRENIESDLERQIASAYHRRDRLLRLIPVQQGLTSEDSGAGFLASLSSTPTEATGPHKITKSKQVNRGSPSLTPISRSTPDSTLQKIRDITAHDPLSRKIENNSVKQRKARLAKQTLPKVMTVTQTDKELNKPVTIMSKQFDMKLGDNTDKDPTNKPVATVVGFPAKGSQRVKASGLPNASNYVSNGNYGESAGNSNVPWTKSQSHVQPADNSRTPRNGHTVLRTQPANSNNIASRGTVVRAQKDTKNSLTSFTSK